MTPNFIPMTLARISLITALLSLTFSVWADERADSADLSQAQFHFKHQSFAVGSQVGSRVGSQYFDGQIRPDSQSAFFAEDETLSGRIEQYDATITYPFKPRELFNLDLGINIRFIDGDLANGDVEQVTQSLNTALPMFYASALFDLPYEGLSASLGASHFEYEQYYALDYKAMLSYQWQSGLGMEGGWQHQELSIDGSEFQTDIQNNGLFLDLKYRF